MAVIDVMEAEPARIDPQLDAIDQALAASDALSLTRSVQTLDASLTRHMRHEENEALPLVETFLGHEGWAAFGRAIRKTQGLQVGGSQLGTDLNRDRLVAALADQGVQPVRQKSIDDTWSALRFRPANK